MTGPARLPKHTSDYCNSLASANCLKRLWWRHSYSAQRVSPPPRLLLVVLLSAQILFLAIVRLGPAASLWTSNISDTPPSSSSSSSLISGSAASIRALKFLPQDNHPSLLHGERKPLPWSSPSALSSDIILTAIHDDPPSSDEQKHLFQASSAVQGSPSMKKHVFKKKPTSKKKNEPPLLDLKEENSNVPSLDKQESAGDEVVFKEESSDATDSGSTEKIEETLTIADGLLPSVEDKFLAEPASGASPIDSEEVSHIHKSSPTIEDKGAEEDASILQTEVEHSAEAQNEAMTTPPREIGGVQREPAVTKEEALIAEKASEAVTAEAEAKSEPVVQEEQAFSEEKVSETSTYIQVLNGPKKEEQASISEKHREEAAAASSENETQNPPVVKEEQASISEKHREEAAAASSENETQNPPVVKEEQAHLIAQKLSEETSSSQCGYGYIYVYDLPPIFNRDIIANCTALNPWLDVCPTLLNGGLGDTLGNASPLGQTGSWYVSDQFTAEVVFHNRILQHSCLTDKPELASGFYIPFYAGLDVGRYLWSGFSAERRDRVSNQLLEWLGKQQAWKRNGGWDHFMMIGRITWDFRRSKDEDWGSGFFYNPSMQNITKLLIERNPWDDKEMAVPYPTNFHPQSDTDLVAWQNHIRSLKRSSLFSFAGAPRKGFPDDFRGILLEQCQQAESCQSLDCTNRTCDNNQKTLELFMDSTFCLQPRGDSFTRRSTFDCLLAGSIPVFFWHRSAYLQYKWHLPGDEASYSVFISKQDIRNGTKIEEVLKTITPEKVQSMQEAVIRIAPKIVYAVSGFSLKEEKDAFDVAIEGVMRRFKELSLSSER